MKHLRLTSLERDQITNILKTTSDARALRRAVILLDLDRGRGPSELAAEFHISRSGIYDLAARFRRHRRRCLKTLSDRGRPGRPSIWDSNLRRYLRRTINVEPYKFGYFAVGWTVTLLGEHLKCMTGKTVSDTSLRRELHRLGYAWKRPRYKLITDHEREKKKPDSEGTETYSQKVSRAI